MHCLQKFTIEPGGWLLLALLYFFGDGEGLLVILGNVAVHEAGHLLMLRRFGVYIRGITFDLTGLCIQYNGLYLTPRREFLAAAAGPGAGLLAALLTSVAGNLLHGDVLLLFAGAGIVLSMFNLLPAKPLDGWRILSILWPAAAEAVSVLTAMGVLVVGLYLMYMGYGIALACMGILLLMQDGAISKPGKRAAVL